MAKKGPDRYPLLKYLEIQQNQDRYLINLLRQSAFRIDKQIKAITGTGPGAIMAKAQLEAQRAAIRSEIGTLMTSAGISVGKGQREAAIAASKAISRYEKKALLKIMTPAEYESLVAAEANRAAAGVQTLLTRLSANNIPLSAQVYKTRQFMFGQVDKMINQALAQGLSADQFARMAKAFIDPATPGGASYAAFRLARTEINNAFHAAANQRYLDSGLVTNVNWNLSKSHPHIDLCDAYAAASPFKVTAVPLKPHPQCFCYTTPDIISPEDFLDNLFGGMYDQPVVDALGVSSVPVWRQVLSAGLIELAAAGRALAISESKLLAKEVIIEGSFQRALDKRIAASLGTSVADRRLALAAAGNAGKEIAIIQAGVAEGTLVLTAGQSKALQLAIEAVKAGSVARELEAAKTFKALAASVSQETADKLLAQQVAALPKIGAFVPKVYPINLLGKDAVNFELGLKKEFIQVYENRSFAGFTMIVDNVASGQFAGQPGTTLVEMSVYNKAGKRVGSVERIFGMDSAGNITVYHELMKLDSEWQGKGFSTAFSKFSEAWYKSSGVKQIGVLAALDKGGYAWAKAGYGWDKAYYRKAAGRGGFIDAPSLIDIRLHGLAKEDFPNISPSRWRRVTSWINGFRSGDINKWPSPQDIVDSGIKFKLSNGDVVDFGKWLMTGSSWHGVKPLK